MIFALVLSTKTMQVFFFDVHILLADCYVCSLGYLCGGRENMPQYIDVAKPVKEMKGRTGPC